jgi:polysaccharide export outer membrane protein
MFRATVDNNPQWSNLTNVISVTLVVIAMVTIATAQGATSGQPETPSNQSQNYRIGPGDVIDVTVSQSATLTRSGIRVNNEGMIQLAMVEEDVAAGCRTERELAEQIKERYKKFVLNPYVTVAVQQVNSNPVAMIGAVNAPGRFQMQRPVKILELLTYVNGPTEKAGTTLELIRNRSLPYCDGSKLIQAGEGVGDEVIMINLSDTFKGVPEANPYVRSGDIVRLGEADQSRAYITGNVKNATAINLTEPITLTQAIAMAGGLSDGAQSEKIVIRRQVNGSLNRTETIVNLKEIKQQKKDDVLLRPNDIIEVPGPGKFGSFLRTLLPSFTQLPLRVIP